MVNPKTFHCDNCGQDKPVVKGLQPVRAKGVAFPREGMSASYTARIICQRCWVRTTYGEVAATNLPE